MHKFLRWKSIFYPLAATLNIFFKGLSIFDLDQTFLSKFLVQIIKISHLKTGHLLACLRF